MAEVPTRHRRGAKNKRAKPKGQVNGCTSTVRLASIKLPVVSGAHINGPGAEFGQIDYFENLYPYLEAGGYLHIALTYDQPTLFELPEPEIPNATALYNRIQRAQTTMLARFDDTSFCKVYHDGDYKDAIVGYHNMDISEDCRYHCVSELEGHPEEIQKVCMACLNLITRMGFRRIDQTGFFEMFLEADYGDEDEAVTPEHQEFLDLQARYRDNPMILVANDSLVRQYSEYPTPLGEWCRLCLAYGTSDFDICDFQPHLIEQDNPTIHITESHIIMFNLQDALWQHYSDEVNSTWENGGCLPICDFEIYTAEACISRCEGVDRRKVSQDINRIWDFYLKTLEFYSDADNDTR